MRHDQKQAMSCRFSRADCADRKGNSMAGLRVAGGPGHIGSSRGDDAMPVDAAACYDPGLSWEVLADATAPRNITDILDTRFMRIRFANLPRWHCTGRAVPASARDGS
jgi:hypothetical protein